MLGNRCIGCASQCNGAEEQGAVHMVRIRGVNWPVAMVWVNVRCSKVVGVQRVALV